MKQAIILPTIFNQKGNVNTSTNLFKDVEDSMQVNSH